VRAVIADISTPRYLITAAAQKVPAGLGRNAGWSPAGVIRLVEDLPAPELPAAPGWVRLRPELAGICGSDVGIAHAKSSFVLTAFYHAQQQVLGHEVVGVVEDTGAGVTGLSPGDRVMVNPIFSCAQRGFTPACRACREGFAGVCERFDEPGVSGCAAPSIGFDAHVGGGWGEQLIAHQSQLYPAGSIPSRRAVLAEPASVGLHAALRWERRGDRVVVIGPGTIGLLVTASLRMLHPDLDIIVLTPDEFGAEQARRAGATRTLRSGPNAVEELAESDGGRVLRPRMTPVPILEQGVDAVFDCVGSSDTINLGLHLLRSTGCFVLVGAAGKQSVDWSLVWNRQLTIAGTINFGPETALNGTHTMAQIADWLADDRYQVDGLVTHSFELHQFGEALTTAGQGPRAKCVKATFRPNPDIELVP
jgi:threonine dehydrogenase-like Zn-dependent dehydrogenase